MDSKDFKHIIQDLWAHLFSFWLIFEDEARVTKRPESNVVKEYRSWIQSNPRFLAKTLNAVLLMLEQWKWFCCFRNWHAFFIFLFLAKIIISVFIEKCATLWVSLCSETLHVELCLWILMGGGTSFAFNKPLWFMFDVCVTFREEKRKFPTYRQLYNYWHP